MNEDQDSNDGEALIKVALDVLQKPAKAGLSESDRRRARAAAKLKENLSRRKQQVRARRAGEADQTEGLPAAQETDGLPAAKMDKL